MKRKTAMPEEPKVACPICQAETKESEMIPEAMAGALMERAREHGLLIGKGGLHGNVLRIAPPLSLTQDEADEGFAILERAVEEVAGL